MEVISTILAPIFWLLGWLLAILWWILSYLLWALVWLVLPLAVLAFVALRIAEKVMGPDVVRGYVRRQTLKYGNSAWVRARRLTFALGVLPLRVLGYFVLYAIWHSIISLLWRPKWHPWPHAWAKRWKPKNPAPRSKAARAP